MGESTFSCLIGAFRRKADYTNDDYIFYGDLLFYDVDASASNSGSPVYTITKIDDKYIYTVISIYAGDALNRDIGPMITNYHLQFYKNNPNASYSSN